MLVQILGKRKTTSAKLDESVNGFRRCGLAKRNVVLREHFNKLLETCLLGGLNDKASCIINSSHCPGLRQGSISF